MKRNASVVIPAFNESGTIRQVLEKLRDGAYETLVVDDGSVDGTSDIAEGMGFRCIRLERNRGKGYACREGIRQASNEKIVLFDADNQFDPAQIPSMLEMLEDSDIVIGERDMKNVPWQRRLSNSFAAWLVSISAGRRFRDVLCGFRAVRKQSFMGLGMEKDRYEFESEMVIKSVMKGFRVSTLPVSVRYFRGASGISIGHSFMVTLFIIKQLIKPG